MRVALMLAVLAGCATLSGDRTESVVVTSTQPGADVLVNGRRVGKTPTTLVLRVDVPADIRVVSHAGLAHTCRPHTTVHAAPVVLQAVPPLWVGLVIDAWTGAWNDLADTCAAP